MKRMIRIDEEHSSSDEQKLNVDRKIQLEEVNNNDEKWQFEIKDTKTKEEILKSWPYWKRLLVAGSSYERDDFPEFMKHKAIKCYLLCGEKVYQEKQQHLKDVVDFIKKFGDNTRIEKINELFENGIIHYFNEFD